MRRYGNNLTSNTLDEIDTPGKTKVQNLAGNCAVRQDMVAFLIPVDASVKRQPPKLLTFLKSTLTKRAEENK